MVNGEGRSEFTIWRNWHHLRDLDPRPSVYTHKNVGLGSILLQLLRLPVGPVKDVQSSVGAEGKKVMRCDRFGLSGLADHEQLGQDGDRLQVDGKGPQDLHDVEGMIDDQRNEGRRNQKEFCEGIEL